MDKQIANFHLTVRYHEMNLQLPGSNNIPHVLRVLMVNPLVHASKLTAMKILSGSVFGENQLLDLILLVYLNEKAAAEAFKFELMCCAFPCIHSIIISSDLPSISDADVFCFITDFSNPNFLDLENIDHTTFDTLYLIIKLANHFTKPEPEEDKTDPDKITSRKKPPKQEQKPLKPIIVADGLIAIDILKNMSQDLPYDIFFCPTPFKGIGKCVLADHLKVSCDDLNNLLVWAANDQVFHIEVENPLVVKHKVEKASHCDWDGAGKEVWDMFNHDHTQFSPAWMKKDFIEKVALSASKNSHGCIYRAAEFSELLRTIWKARTCERGMKFYCSMGVISDGASETIKGYPYVLPLILSGDSWSVNTSCDKDPHVIHEIKRINKTVRVLHQKLMPYCKKFLQDNVINQAFVPVDDSESAYSLREESSRSSMLL